MLAKWNHSIYELDLKPECNGLKSSGVRYEKWPNKLHIDLDLEDVLPSLNHLSNVVTTYWHNTFSLISREWNWKIKMWDMKNVQTICRFRFRRCFTKSCPCHFCIFITLIQNSNFIDTFVVVNRNRYETLFSTYITLVVQKVLLTWNGSSQPFHALICFQETWLKSFKVSPLSVREQ